MKSDQEICLAVISESLDSVIPRNISTGCLDLVQSKYSSLYSGVLNFVAESYFGVCGGG